MKDGNGTPSDATSCVSSTGDASGSVKESEFDYEPLAMPYSPTNYCGYYYPGLLFDASFCVVIYICKQVFWFFFLALINVSTGYEGYPGGVDDQGYYVSGDGLEIQYPVSFLISTNYRNGW